MTGIIINRNGQSINLAHRLRRTRRSKEKGEKLIVRSSGVSASLCLRGVNNEEEIREYDNGRNIIYSYRIEAPLLSIHYIIVRFKAATENH